MSAELIGGLVAAVLSLSLLLGIFLNYLDSRRDKKRIVQERKGSGIKRG